MKGTVKLKSRWQKSDFYDFFLFAFQRPTFQPSSLHKKGRRPLRTDDPFLTAVRRCLIHLSTVRSSNVSTGRRNTRSGQRHFFSLLIRHHAEPFGFSGIFHVSDAWHNDSPSRLRQMPDTKLGPRFQALKHRPVEIRKRRETQIYQRILTRVHRVRF